MPRHEMTKSDSSRVQSSQAKSGGDISSGGFAARAQAAGDRWAASQTTRASSQTTRASGFTGGTSGSNQPSTGTSATSETKK
ncbi:hypothetical protein CONLIGDRAFT_77103 [Coniochaeta ligniaria NRRL 30616]|uniref:SMP domain-containing protein n=1 Tax=Coniochaeta ligniaria NRRL 30616 TaxID=1408157 RepID=A0A1J7J583_9PEZI|nr:hypothetical protein CONLIGDRAFT_77103 [Coniochaeta ligniaria NRRL 30616]